MIYVDGSSDTTSEEDVETSMEAVQCLYAFIVKKVCTYPVNGEHVSHFGQKQQHSPSPIDLDIEEIAHPEVCLKATVAAGRDNPSPPLANNSTVP
jgi:hypothetical protein